MKETEVFENGDIEESSNEAPYVIVMINQETNKAYKSEVALDDEFNEYIMTFDSEVCNGIPNPSMEILPNGEGRILVKISSMDDDNDEVFVYEAIPFVKSEWTEELEEIFNSIKPFEKNIDDFTISEGE